MGSHQAPTATTRFIETSPGRDGEAAGLVAGRVPRPQAAQAPLLFCCSEINRAHLLIKYEVAADAPVAGAFPGAAQPRCDTARAKLKPISHSRWQFSTDNKTESSRCNISKRM